MSANGALEARLLRKTGQGKAVLFLGAGASQSAGAPDGIELARMVHDEFLPSTECTSNDFIEILSNVINTPGVDRHSIEEFVRSKLNVQPSQAHLDLCRIRWRAIFTTNYDDLVEAAYRSAPNKAQDRCDPVYDQHFSRTESDYMTTVHLFKLMGSVNGTERKSRMALSRSDYHRKLQQRYGLFKYLKDMARDGTIIYVGYSFSDLIAVDVLDEIREEAPVDEMPWSWAVLPDFDSKTEQMLRERRIIPLKMRFEQFVALCLTALDEGMTQEEPVVSVTVAGVSIEIPRGDLQMYQRQFEFCHDDLGNQPVPDRVEAVRKFFDGEADPWVGISRGWAFKRATELKILQQLEDQLGRTLERECPVVLVLGPAGCGKTIAARSLAHDVYARLGLPCLFLNPEREKVDYRVIDSFARFLNDAVKSASTPTIRLPLLIIVDEAAARMQDVRRLPQYLASRGIAATLLALARENEWRQAEGSYPVHVDSEVHLPDILENEEEVRSLVNHLRSIDILTSAQDDEYWITQIRTNFGNSFWDALYHLVDPARPPLTLAVRSEYDRLVPVAQTAYRYICSFYQFSVPLDLELLARSLHRSYEQFVQSVYDPASLGVIIDHIEPVGHRYRARTRMVAEQVANYVHQSTDEWLAELRGIVSNVLPNNTNEVETIRNLLIHRLGPNGTNPVRPAAMLIPVFEAVFDAGMRDSATLHHCALLLLDEDDFSGAESYLNQALAVLNDPNELSHLKTEWRQMIDNSLASVAAKKGLHLQSVGEEAKAAKEFQRASILFKNARGGEFPNYYAYYGHAWMLLRQSDSASGTEHLVLLAQALQVTDESDGNISDEGRSSLAEIESRIVERLSDVTGLNMALAAMDASGDSTGSYLRARRSSFVYAREDDVPGYSLATAYSVVMEALARTPDHVPCLRLAVRLHKRTLPDDWKGLWNLLQRWFSLEEKPSASYLLIFDLALTACQLGDYASARPFFEQLDQTSSGHPRRSGIVAVVKDREEDRRLAGEIQAGMSRTQGWLHCDTLGQSLRFYPLRQRFTPATGQKVSFALALNYRGPFAVELRPT